MNIHLPAILGFTRYQGFDPSPYKDRGSDKGEELCRKKNERYKTHHFCNYKIQSTTWFDSENNSRYALQKPMHLKLKNSWKSEMLTWIFPITFCSWAYAIQSSDQDTFQKAFCSCQIEFDWIKCWPRAVVRYDSVLAAFYGCFNFLNIYTTTKCKWDFMLDDSTNSTYTTTKYKWGF